MNDKTDEAIRAAVRDHYASVATGVTKDDPEAPRVKGTAVAAHRHAVAEALPPPL